MISASKLAAKMSLGSPNRRCTAAVISRMYGSDNSIVEPNLKQQKDQKSTKQSKSKLQEPIESSLVTGEIKASRLAKLHSIRDAGLEPFAYSFDKNCNAQDLHRKYADLPPDQLDETADIRFAGRIMIRRLLGKLAFFQMMDESGTIQLYFDLGKFDDPELAKKNLNDWTDAGIQIMATMEIVSKENKNRITVIVDLLTMHNSFIR